MPEELISSPGGAVIQIFGILLISAIFLFLWRTSGMLHFGWWSLAWAIESQALLTELFPGLDFLHALLECGFALALVAAATTRAPRTRLAFSVLLLLLYTTLWRRTEVQFAVLGIVYAFSLYAIGILGNH